MKKTDGLTKPLPSLLTILASIASFLLLARAVKVLDIGPSYAIWTGIGAVGATVLGILWFGESSHPLRLACIVLIVVGVVGLWLTPR